MLLTEGVRAQALSDRDRRIHVIGLRRLPVASEDAAMIAEELEHCIYDEEGFPGVVPLAPQYSHLAAVINSMLGDPIAHMRLRAFGFAFGATLRKRERSEIPAATWDSS